MGIPLVRCSLSCLALPRLILVLATGRFAVKKVAVGQSHSYLLNILREVSQSFYGGFMAAKRSFLGSSTGKSTPSEYHHVSSCVVGDLSIFILRTQSANSAVGNHLITIRSPSHTLQYPNAVGGGRKSGRLY